MFWLPDLGSEIGLLLKHAWVFPFPSYSLWLLIRHLPLSWQAASGCQWQGVLDKQQHLLEAKNGARLQPYGQCSLVVAHEPLQERLCLPTVPSS